MHSLLEGYIKGIVWVHARVDVCLGVIVFVCGCVFGRVCVYFKCVCGCVFGRVCVSVCGHSRGCSFNLIDLIRRM